MGFGAKVRAQHPLNPSKSHLRPLILGDPFMYKDGNTYYFTGTYGDTNHGFPCYVSGDMKNWTWKGMLWMKDSAGWASGSFWAPEVKRYKSRFYLVYSGWSEEIKGLRLALTAADSPAGPFKDLYAPWFDYGFGAIDGHLFIDEDQPYLLFSMNGSKEGYSFGIIYGVKLSGDLSHPVGDTVKLLEASQPWERVNWAHNRCNEGPFVFKYHDTYYMTYSGNHTFEPNCGIGYATASSPLGPWIKAAENPIASRDNILHISGIGHNSLLPTEKENEKLIIYHTHEDPANPQNEKRHANVGLLRIDSNGKLLFTPQVAQ